MVFQVKMPENGGKNIFREKQITTRYRKCFQVMKCLRKSNDCVFGLIQQTIEVQCMYLAFKEVEIRSKKIQQS